MITKIEKLKNIGNFEDYNAKGDVTLKKLSIVYAYNGAGKTTLARVFHSLSTNDPSVVLRHKRINGTGNPEITINNDTPSPFVFSGTKWNRPCPEIEVFDAHFVANNVYSGFEISSEQHKNLYQFVVGASGVEIVKKVERVKNLITASNAEKARIAELITAKANYKDVDKICCLPQKDKVDELITEKEKELTLAKGQQQIAAQKVPEGITVSAPAFSAAAAQRVLETTVEGIGEAYLEEVKAHLDAMFRAGMTKCSDWVYQGTTILNGAELTVNGQNTCPFCGQMIDGVELVKGYNQYFSQEYRSALKNARDLLTLFEQINIESYLLRLKGQYQQIEAAHKFWKTLLTDQPDVPPFDVESLKLEEKYTALKEVVIRKTENPVKAVSLDALRAFKEAMDAVATMSVQVNAYVKSYVAKIAELRAKIRPVAEVEKELKALLIYKARYEEPLKGYCKKYDIVCHQLARLQRINRQLQADQKAASAALFQQYGQKTNYYLRDVFMTPFQIADVKDAFRGTSKKPNLDYTLTFNGTPILQDDGMLNTSFKNVLSEGDKNTIAFSFFLAKLTRDPDLANKIVVFDDPLTSLDQNRRKATIHELTKLLKKCHQLIVLSHNLQFLIEMTGRNDTAKKTTKVVWIAKNGNTAKIEVFELRQEWMDKYKRSLLDMESFVSNPVPGKPQDDAICGIRITLELLLKLKYCKYHNDQNGTFGELIDLLEGKPECEFINPNKEEVISNLRKLNEAAWKPHHSEVGEREAFHDEDMTTEEAVNYTKLALRMLSKEL